MSSYSVTLHVDRDGEPLYRLHVDPQCLHVTTRRNELQRAHIAHAEACQCGVLPIKAADEWVCRDPQAVGCTHGGHHAGGCSTIGCLCTIPYGSRGVA